MTCCCVDRAVAIIVGLTGCDAASMAATEAWDSCVVGTWALGLNCTDLVGEPGAGAALFFWLSVMLVVLIVAVLLDADVDPFVFLVSTTICFCPLLIPFLGVTVSSMGRSEAPASTDLGTLIVWSVWLPSGPAMGTWMEIRSELAALAGLGDGAGLA